MGDYLTEMMTGVDGSIRLVGRVLIRTGYKLPDEHADKLKVMIAGTLIGPKELIEPTLLVGYNNEPTPADELWDCDVILIPRRKRFSTSTLGWQVEDMLGRALTDDTLWQELPAEVQP